MSGRLALGVDLGGTAVKVGVVTPDGEIIGRSQVPTEAEQGLDGVVANMVRAAHAAAADAGVQLPDLQGVGLGVPGPCDVSVGVVVHAVNLGWRNVPIAPILAEKLGLQVHLDNDANCAVLGEQWCGAAKGSQHVILFTIGTGVGGGLILGGKIYHGFAGWAGELGHMPVVAEGGVPCNCGRHGCLETVASATAMVRTAKERIGQGKAPGLAALAQGGKVNGRLVITAARSGDETAIGIIRDMGIHLGRSAAALVSALNPELVLVGGGASNADDLLLEPMRQALREHAMPGPGAVAKVAKAALGNDAGLIGAASLVWR